MSNGQFQNVNNLISLEIDSTTVDTIYSISLNDDNSFKFDSFVIGSDKYFNKFGPFNFDSENNYYEEMVKNNDYIMLYEFGFLIQKHLYKEFSDQLFKLAEKFYMKSGQLNFPKAIYQLGILNRRADKHQKFINCMIVASKKKYSIAYDCLKKFYDLRKNTELKIYDKAISRDPHYLTSIIAGLEFYSDKFGMIKSKNDFNTINKYIKFAASSDDYYALLKIAEFLSKLAVNEPSTWIPREEISIDFQLSETGIKIKNLIHKCFKKAFDINPSYTRGFEKQIINILSYHLEEFNFYKTEINDLINDLDETKISNMYYLFDNYPSLEFGINDLHRQICQKSFDIIKKVNVIPKDIGAIFEVLNEDNRYNDLLDLAIISDLAEFLYSLDVLCHFYSDVNIDRIIYYIINKMSFSNRLKNIFYEKHRLNQRLKLESFEKMDNLPDCLKEIIYSY